MRLRPFRGRRDVDEGRVAELARLKARLPHYPMRVVYLLMIVSAVDAGERSILPIVFEDIKHAFGVSDSALGLLVAAYSVVATVSALPFGILADRWNRVRLIALGFIPWSLGMFWTAASASFGMMWGARLFLGSIEATNGPATPSLLGDYFPTRRRSRVLGVYQVGSLGGTLVGLAVAGALATWVGWRFTFVAWGVAGLACALAVINYLPNPERGLPDAIEASESRLTAAVDEPSADSDDGSGGPNGASADYRTMSARAAFGQIARIPTLWIVVVGEAFGGFVTGGISTWAPTFFRRYHDMSAFGAGLATAIIPIGAVGGILVGARLGDRYLAEGRPHLRMVLGAVSNAATLGLLVPAFATESLPVSIVLFFLASITATLPLAALLAVGLDVVAPRLRGRSNALRSIVRVAFTASSPLLFGILSEFFGLRQAILMTLPLMAVNAAVLLLAIRTYPRDLARAAGEALRQVELEDRE